MMLRHLPELAQAVQRNCDISDARHAGDYGLCTFLLKMREYYRWENELPFGRSLPKDELGEWLKSREQAWEAIEEEAFEPLPLASGALDPFEAAAANRELLPQGGVYGAGYGRMGKPVFFLGALERIEEREGLTICVSSCEYARELAAPPAMLQGRTIYVRLEGDVVKDVSFVGQGCSISTASASLMTEALKGRTLAEARALFHQMHETCTGQPDTETAGLEPVALGKLAVFEGVRQYPLRVKCATLAWHTLRNALEGRLSERASTE